MTIKRHRGAIMFLYWSDSPFLLGFISWAFFHGGLWLWKNNFLRFILYVSFQGYKHFSFVVKNVSVLRNNGKNQSAFKWQPVIEIWLLDEQMQCTYNKFFDQATQYAFIDVEVEKTCHVRVKLIHRGFHTIKEVKP